MECPLTSPKVEVWVEVVDFHWHSCSQGSVGSRPPQFLWSFPKNWTQRIPSPLSSQGIYDDKLDKLDRQSFHMSLWNAQYVHQTRHKCILDLKNLVWYAFSDVRFVYNTTNYPRSRQFLLGSMTKVKFCWPVYRSEFTFIQLRLHFRVRKIILEFGTHPRRHRGVDAILLGFSENNSRTDRPIVTKLGIPNHWTILYLPWKFQVRTYYDLRPVTWFTRSCQTTFVYRTVSTPKTCELRYVCWRYGHG